MPPEELQQEFVQGGKLEFGERDSSGSRFERFTPFQDTAFDTKPVGMLSSERGQRKVVDDIGRINDLTKPKEIVEGQQEQIDQKAELDKRKQEQLDAGALDKATLEELIGTENAQGFEFDPETQLFTPTGAEVTPEAKALQEFTNEVTLRREERLKLFDSLSEDVDESTKLLISDINRRFDERDAKMQDINRRRAKQTQTFGIRIGTERFAPGVAGGIVTEEERQGEQRLKELTSERISLIAQAKQASQTKQFDILAKKIDLIEKVDADRLKALERQGEIAIEETKKLAIEQKELEIDSTILDLFNSGITSTAQIFQGLTNKGLTIGLEELADKMKNLEEDDIKKLSLSGKVKDFKSFVDIGLISPSLSIKEQWDAFIDLTKEDKVLSPANAKALGVSFGTTESEAFGKFAITEPKDAKPPSSSQFQAGTFSKRMEQAENELTGGRGLFTPFAPEFLKTEDRRLFEQAERNFINALLRRESGAAIADSEFDSARLQYIPIATDSEDVLDAKAQNRRIVFEGLKAESGNAFGIISEQVGGFNAFNVSKEEQELLDAGFTPQQIQEIKNAK